MDNEKLLTEEEIYEECAIRFKEDGSYNLWDIEAFVTGAKTAVELKKEGKGMLNSNVIAEGYVWAAEKMWK